MKLFKAKKSPRVSPESWADHMVRLDQEKVIGDKNGDKNVRVDEKKDDRKKENYDKNEDSKDHLGLVFDSTYLIKLYFARK